MSFGRHFHVYHVTTRALSFSMTSEGLDRKFCHKLIVSVKLKVMFNIILITLSFSMNNFFYGMHILNYFLRVSNDLETYLRRICLLLFARLTVLSLLIKFEAYVYPLSICLVADVLPAVAIIFLLIARKGCVFTVFRLRLTGNTCVARLILNFFV